MSPSKPVSEAAVGWPSATPPARPEALHQWSPAYWEAARHGVAWAQAASRLAAAIAERRDPSRKWLGGLPDTGRHAAPLEGAPLSVDDGRLIEAGARYGVGARLQYAESWSDWNDTVEERLRAEWDENTTGVPFDRVREYVRIGWALHE